MRVKVEYRTNSRAVYEKFCTQHPEIRLTFKEWKKIIETYNGLYRDYMLETGERTKMPYGFGFFTITKKKMAQTKEYKGVTYINLPIDWAKTKLLGMRMYTFNAHTSGYRYKWLWRCREARFYLSDTFNFKPSRVTSRKLAEYINKPNSIYAQIYKEWIK